MKRNPILSAVRERVRLHAHRSQLDHRAHTNELVMRVKKYEEHFE